MKSIAIKERDHKEVKAFCKTIGLNIGEFVPCAATYFKRTGIDPSKDDSESPHKVVKELERRIGQVIAYIKTHEKDKLNPLLESLIILSRQMEDTIQKAPKAERFEHVIKQMEEMIDADQNHHVEQLRRQDNYYKQILEILQKNYLQTHTKNINKLDEMAGIIKGLREEQESIKTVIEGKLSKKIF